MSALFFLDSVIKLTFTPSVLTLITQCDCSEKKEKCFSPFFFFDQREKVKQSGNPITIPSPWQFTASHLWNCYEAIGELAICGQQKWKIKRSVSTLHWLPDQRCLGAGRGERVSKKSKRIDVTSNVLYRVRSLTQIHCVFPWHKTHSDNQRAMESPGWGDDSKFAPVRYGRSGSAEKQQQHTNTAKAPLWLEKANMKSTLPKQEWVWAEVQNLMLV